MDREPNLVTSGCSRQIVEDGIPFDVEIYKLEGQSEWTLEVVTEDGTSIVWDDAFSDDQEAFDEALAAIRKEGARAFRDGGDNIIPFRR